MEKITTKNIIMEYLKENFVNTYVDFNITTAVQVTRRQAFDFYVALGFNKNDFLGTSNEGSYGADKNHNINGYYIEVFVMKGFDPISPQVVYDYFNSPKDQLKALPIPNDGVDYVSIKATKDLKCWENTSASIIPKGYVSWILKEGWDSNCFLPENNRFETNFIKSNFELIGQSIEPNNQTDLSSSPVIFEGVEVVPNTWYYLESGFKWLVKDIEYKEGNFWGILWDCDAKKFFSIKITTKIQLNFNSIGKFRKATQEDLSNYLTTDHPDYPKSNLKIEWVKCNTQEEWDYAAKKLGRTSIVAYKRYGDCICLSNPNNSNCVKNDSTNLVLSFEDWCKHSGNNDFMVKNEPVTIEEIQEECKRRFPIGCTFKSAGGDNIYTLREDSDNYRSIGDKGIDAGTFMGWLYRDEEYAKLISLPDSNENKIIVPQELYTLKGGTDSVTYCLESSDEVPGNSNYPMTPKKCYNSHELFTVNLLDGEPSFTPVIIEKEQPLSLINFLD